MGLVSVFLVPSAASAYEPVPPSSHVKPYDANLPHGVHLKVPKAGLDFLAGQLEAGLQGNSLRTTIVEALEGQYFEIVLPIFGGNLRLTIPCGEDNTHKAELAYDKTYKIDRLWCPYARGDVAIGGQSPLPVTTVNDDGFRYERVALEASTYPISNLALPMPNSLFAALFLLESDGKHAQLDMVVDHPLFKIQVPVVDPVTLTFTTQCFNLLGSGAGCESTFIATLEADLVTGGQLKPFFETNTLFVLVNDFHTQLTNLKILTPFTQNTALMTALEACILANAPGISPGCVGQKEQIELLYEVVEEAFGDAALQFFERELNAALSGVLEDGINQLMFDRSKDGTPDPVINLNLLAGGLSDFSGKPFEFNFEARYEASSTDPVESFFIMDGGLYAGDFSTCVSPGANPVFRYTELELDGNTGHDGPQMGSVIPGTSKPYQLGFAVSDDLINQLIYNVWAAGMLCISLDAGDPSAPPELVELLNTDSFVPFLKWLPKLAPHAPVMIQLTPQEAPYVTFGGGGESLFRIHMPNVNLDLYVEVGSGADKRPMRAFGMSADITVAIDVNAINFDKSPLIDLEVNFESATASVLFDDLHPEHDEKIVALISPVLDLMAPSLAELVGNIQVPFVTDCIGGIRQQDLVLGSSGNDPVSGFDHYLSLYMNFTGLIDFNKIISECMLALAAPRDIAAPAIDSGFVRDNPVAFNVSPFSIDPAREYRWRLDGGFWSPKQRGDFKPRPMLNGKHRLEFEQDGQRRGVQFFVDSAAPDVRFTQEGDRLRVETIDISRVFTRIDGGNWSAEPIRELQLGKERHTYRVETRDAAGNEAVYHTTVAPRETTPGCSSSGNSALSWLIAMLPLILLRLRRPLR